MATGDDNECTRCHATTHVEAGDEPTELCHSCVYTRVDELEAALAASEQRAERIRDERDAALTRAEAAEELRNNAYAEVEERISIARRLAEERDDARTQLAEAQAACALAYDQVNHGEEFKAMDTLARHADAGRELLDEKREKP